MTVPVAAPDVEARSPIGRVQQRHKTVFRPRCASSDAQSPAALGIGA